MEIREYRKDCIIVELSNTGHRVSLYLDLNAKAARQAGFNVEVYTSSSAFDTDEFQVFKNNHPNIKITPLSSRWFNSSESTSNQLRLFFLQAMRVKKIKKALKHEKDKTIVFNTFDDFVFGFCFFTTTRDIQLRAIFVSPKMRMMKGLGLKALKNVVTTTLFYFASKRFYSSKSILIIDEIFDSYIDNSKILDNIRDQVRLINDVGEVDHIYDQSDNIDNKTSLTILVYGSLTLRKGIEPLLKSVTGEEFNFNIEVILAGSPDKEVLDLLNSYVVPKKVTITRHLGYVSQKLESQLFNNCDIVWLGYSKKFVSSSGVLYQAWSAGKPVIACSHGLIGARVKKNAAGITVDIDNITEIKKAVFLLGQKTYEYEKLKSNADIAGKNFTKIAFMNSLLDSIYA